MFRIRHSSRSLTASICGQFRLHSTSAHPKLGFALDIDGVLIKVNLKYTRKNLNNQAQGLISFMLKGNRVLPQAKRYDIISVDLVVLYNIFM
jgi:hypothetical protein